MLLFKALIGAGAVVLMSWLSGLRLYYLVGLVPLFPTFALIGNSIAWADGGVPALQQAASFGLMSLFSYASYLIAVYYFSNYFNIYITLLIGVVAWAVVASISVYLWKII